MPSIARVSLPGSVFIELSPGVSRLPCPSLVTLGWCLQPATRTLGNGAPVRTDHYPQPQLSARPGCHSPRPEAAHRAQSRLFETPVRSDLRCGQKGRLAAGAVPTLGPAGLPAQIGVIEFQDAVQRPAVLSLAQRLHQFVLDDPRAVLAHPQFDA